MLYQLNSLLKKLNQLTQALDTDDQELNNQIRALLEEITSECLNLAKHLLRTKQISSAALVLNVILKFDADHIEATSLLKKSTRLQLDTEQTDDLSRSIVYQVMETHKALTEFWFQKATRHYNQHDYHYAFQAYGKVLSLSPQHSVARVLQQECTTFRRRALYVRRLIMDEIYEHRLAALVTQHRHVATKNMPDQLLYANQLIDFILAHFKTDIEPFTFTKPALCKDDLEGRALRRASIDQYMKITGNLVVNGRKNQEYFDDLNRKELRCHAHDFYFNDLKTLLRMVLETIHHFPREVRANYASKLHWGDNSWFYLEFIASLFARGNADKSFHVRVHWDPRKLKPELTPHFINYARSIQGSICIIEIASLELMKSDLLSLRHLFQNIHTHLSGAIPNYEVPNLAETPTINWMLSYFKKQFNFFRLLSLLPFQLNPDQTTLLRCKDSFEKVPIMVYETEFDKYRISTAVPSKNGSLTHKYSVLRRISLIGEQFTNRSWGSDLPHVTFINPKLISAIRNGLGHPDQLPDMTLIRDIETDDAIIALYLELISFRERIVEHVAIRESRFLPFIVNPHEHFFHWRNFVTDYVDSVKKNHKAQREVFNEQTFVPGQALLPNHLMKQVLESFPKESDFYQSMKAQLEGKTRVNSDDFKSHFKEHLTPDSKDKSWIKSLTKYLTQAKDQYNELRSNAQQAINNKNDQLDKEIAQQQMESTKNYPNLDRFGTAFAKALTGKDVEDKQPESVEPKVEKKPEPIKVTADAKEVAAVIKVQQDRLTRLTQLLQESSISLSPLKPFAQQEPAMINLLALLKNNIDAFFAFSYLATQIITTFNRLYTYRELDIALAEEKIKEWVAFRNSLMHSDPVNESVENNYYLIHFNNGPRILFCIVIDLMYNFHDNMMQIDLNRIAEFYTLRASIHQEKPVNIKYFEMMLSAMGSKLTSGYSPGFFAPIQRKEEGKKEQLGPKIGPN